MARRRQQGRSDVSSLVVAAEAGDLEAARRLVDAFLPAIAALARRYPRGMGVERQELIHEGVAGLLFAARRYDSGLDTPFWAYASFWVRKAMQELVAELGGPVALSDRAVRALAHVRAARSEHVQARGTEPSPEELSRATGFTRAQLESLEATQRAPRGIEERLVADGESTITVGDMVIDPGAEQEYQHVLDAIEVEQLADQLTDRERAVIRAHYGLGQSEQTLSQIGGALGLTPERARQIEAAALQKLRDSLVPPALAAREPA